MKKIDILREQLANGIKPEYMMYVQSSIWRSKCLTIMTRANGLCEMCHKNKPRAVHHIHYDNLGFERHHDLLAVCIPCHKKADLDRYEKNDCSYQLDCARECYPFNDLVHETIKPRKEKPAWKFFFDYD